MVVEAFGIPTSPVLVADMTKMPLIPKTLKAVGVVDASSTTRLRVGISILASRDFAAP